MATRLNDLYTELKRRMQPASQAMPEAVFGNKIERCFWPIDRYAFDYAIGRREAGWVNFDSERDASYFGIWLNSTTRQSLQYVEGDWILITCDSPQAYEAMCERLLVEERYWVSRGSEHGMSVEHAVSSAMFVA